MSKSKGAISRREFLELGVGTAGAVLVASAGCSESNIEDVTASRNILITYYSETGNTEKIATAISEELASANATVLKKDGRCESRRYRRFRRHLYRFAHSRK